MRRPKVLFIAQNQPLSIHDHLLKRMASAEERAQRQAHRFPHMDLPALQKEVHRQILNAQFSLSGRYMDLLDLMNAALHDGRPFHPTPEDDVSRFYSLADTVTLNGVYFHQVLSDAGYTPIIVQNYATADLKGLLEERPLAVCISSNFLFMEDILEMASEIRRLSPQTAIIAGGMLVKKALHRGAGLSAGTLGHFSTFAGKLDAFVIESRGEHTLLKVLGALEHKLPLETLPNLACFDGHGSLVFTSRSQEALPMDETAIRWKDLPRGLLRNTLPVTSSRGCAYRCRFCTYHWLFPRVETKSLEVLRDELRQIRDLGFVRHVRFTDDNFTANRQRLEAVLRMLTDERFNFRWSSFARASALTPDLVRAMGASGCEFVDLGLESGSQEILDRMDKRLEVRHAAAAIGWLSAEGIQARGSFIVGYPGETRETFEETLAFIEASGLPYYHPYLFYYTGNTLVHAEKEALGLHGLGLAWRHRTMDAAQAAELLGSMEERLPQSYTDGYSYVEEIYKFLRGRGYGPEAIRELFRQKRALHRVLAAAGRDRPDLPEAREILDRIRAVIGEATPPCTSPSSV